MIGSVSEIKEYMMFFDWNWLVKLWLHLCFRMEVTLVMEKCSLMLCKMLSGNQLK